MSEDDFRVTADGMFLDISEPVPVSNPECSRCRKTIGKEMTGLVVLRALAGSYDAYKRLEEHGGRYHGSRVLCEGCTDQLVEFMALADGA